MVSDVPSCGTSDVPSCVSGTLSSPPGDALSASRDAQGEMYSPGGDQPSSLSLWFSRIILVLDQPRVCPDRLCRRTVCPPARPPASPASPAASQPRQPRPPVRPARPPVRPARQSGPPASPARPPVRPARQSGPPASPARPPVRPARQSGPPASPARPLRRARSPLLLLLGRHRRLTRLRRSAQRRRCHNDAHQTTSLSQRRRCRGRPVCPFSTIRHSVPTIRPSAPTTRRDDGPSHRLSGPSPRTASRREAGGSSSLGQKSLLSTHAPGENSDPVGN